jgi:hypothetical protein
MQKFIFSTSLPNVGITIFDQNGHIITPAENGFIGVFKHGTKLNIFLSVEGEHSCYTLNPKDLTKIPKRKSESGLYSKSLTIDTRSGTGQTAPWPSNMVCLDIPGHIYNIGIANQYGRFFFVIEEYLPSPENLPEGMVIAFSLLRGIGSVAYIPAKGLFPCLDARIHFSAIRISKDGFRLLQTGDFLEWEPKDLIELGGDTSYRYEIKHAVNLSQPN